jgi:hypothetical protein
MQRRLARLAGTGFLAISLASCNLEVFDPDIIEPSDVEDPASIPVVVAGIVGDFQEAFDTHTRYTGMLTDEFILAGTFETRRQVDDRSILIQNNSLNGVWEEISTARFSADNAVAGLTPLIGDPELEDQQDLIRQGVLAGQYFGAYMRLIMAEMYCHSILGGGDPESLNYESAPLLPDARMQQALELFQAAEATATLIGDADLAAAAVVGQARAQMWLGNYQQASALAATVDPGFLSFSEYSANDPAQYNEIYQFTYGDVQFIRWGIGDGTVALRFNERFAYFADWVSAGLIDPDPDPQFQSINDVVPVRLQLIYGRGLPPPDNVGRAAAMLTAAGDLAGAAARINSRLTTGDNPYLATFAPVSFTGVFETDIVEIGRAYLAGTWLTGHRLHFVRRVLRNDGVDLYPPGKLGSDTAFPLEEQEVNNNPDVAQACPTAQPWN